MKHIEYLTSVCDLDGRDALDIGAGDGGFAREMAARGARVTGVEIDADKVAIAAKTAQENVIILEGRGEALPVGDATQDLTCFIFSFHHVPLEVQEAALSEVRRVLRPGGRLHAVDPRPYGDLFNVVRFLEDETVVRTKSQARLDALSGKDDFELLSKNEYVLTRYYADTEDVIKRMVGVDPSRAARVPQVRSKMEAALAEHGREVAEGIALDQPCIAYHFQFSA